MRFGAWIIIAAALLTIFATSAEARHRHHHYRHAHHYARVHHLRKAHRRIHDNRGRGDERVVGSRPSGCPHAFCGCEASLYLFHRSIPALNLAANWIWKFPRAMAAPGMAAARPGHVMVLMSHVEGPYWLVHDGNSGRHLTREHVRSIAGFHVVDPHGSRYASR
jgi:hypothetical protein